MSGPGWDNEAWQQIRDYERFWVPFDTRFRFRAGTRAEAWPAIDEPVGSVTFDLSPFFGRGRAVAADADALNEQVLSAMIEVFPAEVALVALNWQHPSYWFWPHRQAIEQETWRISPFPDGDYHV